MRDKGGNRLPVAYGCIKESAYEPKWPIRPELIQVSVALSN